MAATVDLGLISASRIAVEQRLSTLETPATAHTAALLAVSRAVVVGTESQRRQLAEVAARLDRPDRLQVLPLPTPSLAYPELLPPKDRALVALPDDRPDRLNPEFRERAALARSAVAVLAEPDALAAVRALSYRALPATDPNADLGLPRGMTAAATMPPDPADPAGSGTRIGIADAAEGGRRLVADRHSPRRFAAALTVLATAPWPATERV